MLHIESGMFGILSKKMPGKGRLFNHDKGPGIHPNMVPYTPYKDEINQALDAYA